MACLISCGRPSPQDRPLGAVSTHSRPSACMAPNTAISTAASGTPKMMPFTLRASLLHRCSSRTAFLHSGILMRWISARLDLQDTVQHQSMYTCRRRACSPLRRRRLVSSLEIMLTGLFQRRCFGFSGSGCGIGCADCIAVIMTGIICFMTSATVSATVC